MKGKTKKNLVFGEPPPLVDDSKNIWFAQFQLVYRAFCAANRQILYKGGYVFVRGKPLQFEGTKTFYIPLLMAKPWRKLAKRRYYIRVL